MKLERPLLQKFLEEVALYSKSGPKSTLRGTEDHSEAEDLIAKFADRSWLLKA